MRLTRKQLDVLQTDRLTDFFYGQLGLKKKDADALKFANALIQMTEEQLTRQLVEVFVTKGFSKISKRPDVLEEMIRDLDFTKKINVIKNLDEKRYKSLISFLRVITDLRNRVYHSRFAELKYKGRSLDDVNTQRDALFDYMESTHLK